MNIQQTPVSSPLSGLLFILLIMIITFLGWAYTYDISQYVRGQGRIIPSGKTRSVQHLEGGIVREILVKEGDQVAKDQPLFVIDNIDASTDKNEAKIKLHQLQSSFIRLQAERNNYTDPVFPEELIEQYPEIIEAERQLFNARKKQFKQEIEVLNDQISQKRLTLESLQNTQNNIGAELSVALKQLSLNEKLVKAGSVSQSKYLESQSRVNNFRTRIAQIKKEIPVVRAEEKEIQSKLEQVKQQNDAEIIEDMNKNSFEKKQIEERLSNFDDKISRSTVIAPVTGIVNARFVDTIGGVVQPGGVMADILPLDEQLVIEGEIKTQDRPKVYTGLPVKIRISAYDFRRTNAISGTLTQVSADSFTNQQGESFYKVKVAIDHDGIPENMDIFPGMVVDLHITSGRVSILEAILKPFMDLKNNAFRRI